MTVHQDWQQRNPDIVMMSSQHPNPTNPTLGTPNPTKPKEPHRPKQHKVSKPHCHSKLFKGASLTRTSSQSHSRHTTHGGFRSNLLKPTRKYVQAAYLQGRASPDEHGGEALALDIVQIAHHHLMVYQRPQCNAITPCTWVPSRHNHQTAAYKPAIQTCSAKLQRLKRPMWQVGSNMVESWCYERLRGMCTGALAHAFDKEVMSMWSLLLSI